MDVINTQCHDLNIQFNALDEYEYLYQLIFYEEKSPNLMSRIFHIFFPCDKDLILSLSPPTHTSNILSAGKGRGRQVIAVARTCSLILIILDGQVQGLWSSRPPSAPSHRSSSGVGCIWRLVCSPRDFKPLPVWLNMRLEGKKQVIRSFHGSLSSPISLDFSLDWRRKDVMMICLPIYIDQVRVIGHKWVKEKMEPFGLPQPLVSAICMGPLTTPSHRCKRTSAPRDRFGSVWSTCHLFWAEI